MMKDKNFENMDETKVDETEAMNRPEGIGDAGEPEDKAPKVAVRSKDKAKKDIIAALTKAREMGTISSELSDEDIAGIVTPAVDTLYDAYEKDGIVPTREAFAERCTSEEISGVVLGMARDPFVKRRLGRKTIAAICTGCMVVTVLVGVGVWTVVSGQKQAATDTGVSVSEPAGMYDESDEAQVESGDDVDDESAVKTDEDAQSTSDEGESVGGSTTDEYFATDSGSASTTGGGNVGSDSTGGSGTSSSGQQSHTHNWVPVTTTVHHDAQYKTVHHDAVTQERHICNGCGKDITGNESAHLKENILNGCGGWYSEVVTVQAAYDEQVLVNAAWDETVTTGYKCSICGATK